MAKPTLHITHPDFKYRNSAQTDVRETWRRFGWQPLAAREQYVEPEPVLETPAKRVVRTLLVSKGPK
jgi:hypothetical protein